MVNPHLAGKPQADHAEFYQHSSVAAFLRSLEAAWWKQPPQLVLPAWMRTAGAGSLGYNRGIRSLIR